MAERIARMWCRTCDDWRRCTWAGPNHLLHLILSIVTAGVWLFIWVILSLASEFTCSECGSNSLMTASKFRTWERKQEKLKERAATTRPAEQSASFRAGKALHSRKTEPAEIIPPRPSALLETARAEWDAKYGGRR